MKRLTIKRFITSIMLVAVIAAAPLIAQARIEDDLGENEVKMGQKAVEQLTKDSKLSTNEADLARVRSIGKKIADIANTTQFTAKYGNSRTTPFEYSFYVVEDDAINAFSVPGGFVFINKGLLDFVQSDDELAAVMAHEIVHAAHHHMVYLVREQSSIQSKTIWVLLASLLGGGSGVDTGNLLLGTQLYTVARLNNYGREAERDADYGALYYMSKAGYNPVGMLTFLERLAQKPELVKMGIYSSHPETQERIKNVKKQINEFGIPIERWKTAKLGNVSVQTVDHDQSTDYNLMLDKKIILKVTPYGEISAHQRAYEMADRLDKALQFNLQHFEVTSSGGRLMIRKQVIISVTEADAKNMGKTPSQIAEAAANAIILLIWNQNLSTIN